MSEITGTTNGDPIIKVKGASGAVLDVLTVHEQKWFKEALKKYLAEYSFENIADLQDLDRLLGLELLSYRYTIWLVKGTGLDYDEMQYDETAIRAQKQKLDQEIRLIKKHMGMDRKGRIEEEQQSAAEYIRNLLRRAKEMGLHRDHQITKSIDLFHELRTLVGLHKRSDEEERRHLGVELIDIFQWIEEVAIPEFESIDDAFRKNQRLWIKEVS